MAKRSAKFYRRNERELMGKLGLEPTQNSGSGWIEKEDGQNEYLIAQLKSTDAESMKLQLHDFHKLEYNALVAHKIPIFVIEFLQTNEHYVLMKPVDIPMVAEYLECGKVDVPQVECITLLDEPEIKPAKKIISSGNRASFHAEREKERIKRWGK